MKSLTWLTILFLISAAGANAAIDPESVAGAWLFEEGRGDEAEDASGNGNIGQIMGAKYVDGRFGTGLLFEKAGEVKIDSNEKFQLGEELTMMAYFNAQNFTDWHQLIAKNNEYLLRIDTPAEGTKMSAFVNLNGGWEPRASAFVPKADTWYHFAAVYDGDANQLSVYVDGVLSGQSGRDGKPTPTDNPVTIGHWNGGSRFDGVIDEVAIFNTALDEADIKEIAADGLKTALGASLSVKPVGKLATSWGDIRTAN
jgi:hypothetical protein